MGSIERVILGFRAPEQVELDEARHLIEMTVTRRPNLLEIGLRSLATWKRFMAMNMEGSPQLDGACGYAPHNWQDCGRLDVAKAGRNDLCRPDDGPIRTWTSRGRARYGDDVTTMPAPALA